MKTISVKNNGYVDWEFPEGFSLQVSGEAAADFIISNPLFPAVLKPGESFDIDVKFAPTNGGIREGYIDLQSTDELLSSIRVNLTGTGVNFPQNISFSLQKDIPFRKEPFELPAFASSQLPLTFTSSNNDIATFTSEGFVTKKFGTVTITASQPGNEYFLPAAQVQKEINITIGVQSVGLNVPTTYTYGDAPFQLSGTTSSGNPIKAFSSGNSNLLSIEGSTATIHGTGTVVLTATVDGNEFFQAGEQTFTFTINKAPQTITFPALTAKTFGDAAFDLSAASSSDLAVTFASSDETVATVTGTTVTILKAGTTTITASKPGTDNFLAATPVGQVLTVNKASQTIAFEPLEAMTFGDGTLELSATASNALPVTFSSSDPTIASVADNTLSILKAGAVTITAAQAGNDNYAAAVAQQPFTINKASQSISFDELPTLATSDESIPLVAEASSGLPLTFTSADEAVAVIDGGLLMVAGGGETTITGSQPGNENYLAAEDVARVLVVEEVTGVGSELAGKISVYPNPVQSLLLISHSDLKAGNFAITSITGQLIATGQLEKSGSTRLQTRDLKEGVYLLTVSTHEGNVVYRFIKEN